MSGKPQTSTQTNSSAPWEPSHLALKTGLGDGLNLYKGGIGGAVNTTSQVIPYAKQSMGAMNAGESMAGANMNGRGLSGQYQGIINNGGFNRPQQEAMAGFRKTATGGFNPFDNAGFGSVLKQAQESAMNGVNMNAAAAGRYGSGVHQGNVAREVGNVTGGLMNNEYNNWQNRRDGAQQSMFNAGQTGMGNMGSAFQGMQSPLDLMSKIGGQYEDLATRQMNDRTRMFDALNNQPRKNIEWLNGIASGTGSLGGTSSGTATAPGANPFGQIAGGLLAGSGFFGK